MNKLVFIIMFTAQSVNNTFSQICNVINKANLNVKLRLIKTKTNYFFRNFLKFKLSVFLITSHERRDILFLNGSCLSLSVGTYYKSSAQRSSKGRMQIL